MNDLKEFRRAFSDQPRLLHFRIAAVWSFFNPRSLFINAQSIRRVMRLGRSR